MSAREFGTKMALLARTSSNLPEHTLFFSLNTRIMFFCPTPRIAVMNAEFEFYILRLEIIKLLN
jgi:hypothetical protein